MCCVWCVCVLFVDLFQDDLRYLFNPHQVNHGGVRKPPVQVSLYNSHTTEEPLRKHRSDRYCQVLSSPSSQVGKLFLVLLPPHQRFLPRVVNAVRKVTPPDEKFKIIVFSPFVLYYIDEVLWFVSS